MFFATYAIWYSKSILLFLGMTMEQSIISGNFLRHFIPFLWLNILFDMHRCFLAGCKIFHPAM